MLGGKLECSIFPLDNELKYCDFILLLLLFKINGACCINEKSTFFRL